MNEAQLISDMANLEINKFIRDDLLCLMVGGEFEMCFELALNECKRVQDAMPEYKVTRPFQLINAIDREVEAEKKKRNHEFMVKFN